jgi:hypothetical protein
VLVIATNEELAIAREAYSMLKKKAAASVKERASCVS